MYQAAMRIIENKRGDYHLGSFPPKNRRLEVLSSTLDERTFLPWKAF